MRETDDMMLEIDEHINRVEEEMMRLSDLVRTGQVVSFNNLGDSDSAALYGQVTADIAQMEQKIKDNMAVEFKFLADEWRNFVGTYESMRSEIDALKGSVNDMQECKFSFSF